MGDVEFACGYYAAATYSDSKPAFFINLSFTEFVLLILVI